MTSIVIAKITPPQVTNLIGTSGLKAVSLTWDQINQPGLTGYNVLRNTVDDSSTAVLAASNLTANSFTESGLVAGTSYYYWVYAINQYSASGPVSDGVGPLSLGVITSADTANSAATGISSGVGGASASGSLSGYNTYVPVCMSTFLASDNSIVVVSQVVTIRCGAKSGSGGIEIWIRTRLRDTTTNTDVPAGSKVFLVYRDFLSIVGQANQFFNVNESYISGFRGLLTPGHNYSLITEISRNQLGGTPTMSLDYDSGTSASGAASI